MTRNDTWWRVTYDFNGTRRALFGLGCSSLGGLIIDIGAYKPFGKWRCGVFDLPGGEAAEQVATLDAATLMTPILAPKFHYHPNGFISINHHGHVEDGRFRGLRSTNCTATTSSRCSCGGPTRSRSSRLLVPTT